ncbi:MAG: hypothetical protein HC819_11370 [Cyclobacteriaceae bacterium]|nr:hypothetical protein [Cyclobacteriaceae bacterium]
MEKKNAKFTIDAPYYKLGDIGSHTKKIWLIFHGYGQLIDDFAEPFASFEQEDHCILFPQGLSKFYLKGIDQKIGASWMTSHDREMDIANYINYLNFIFEQEIQPFANKILLNVLGFSQGGHTASRWIAKSHVKYDKLILWGSSLAAEIGSEEVKNHFGNGKTSWWWAIRTST